MDTLKPRRNRPTLGTAATALLVSLLNWWISVWPDTVPDEVAVSARGFGLLAIAIAVGAAVQYLGKHAPWSAEVHSAGVAYALSLDPDEHGEELELALRRLGIKDLDEARQLIGLDTGGSPST